MFFILYKGIVCYFRILQSYLSRLITVILFSFNRVEYKSFKTNGVPYVHVARKARRFVIGSKFRMNNGVMGNPIGYYCKCTFVIHNNSEIVIGNNVGISQAALISHCSIVIEDNVDIGGGVKIYTSDFHSLNPDVRNSDSDHKSMICKPVRICKGAFVGAGCIILKGVTIGRNSVVGAGSVVSHSIPDNQIWAGNPARFIKNVI